MSVQAVLDEQPQTLNTVPSAIEALQAHLRSLRTLVEHLSADAYCATPSRTSGSVGQHVRHCLDHAGALLSGKHRGELSYDSRLRGTRIETHPHAAVDEIARLCVEFEGVDEQALDRVIRLQAMTHADVPPTRVSTTYGREITFVIQHTIHHSAIVALLLDRLGITVPERFGFAPSTPSRQ